MEFSNGISLHIPVYLGGDLFIGALQSIEQTSIEFENVFISFNGVDPRDYNNFVELKRAGNLRKKYSVFRTCKELTAAEHGYFVLGKIKNVLSPNSKLMLLAHDDRILYQKNNEAQNDFFRSLRSDTVYFPAYYYCVAGNYENVIRISAEEKSYTPLDFLRLTMKKNLDTNISGMIIPFSAYESAVNSIIKNATGARAEHLFCMGPSVRCIQFRTDVCSFVGERANSDGRSLSRLDHRRAALSYVWSYAKNGHLIQSGGYLFFAMELLKKIAAYGLEIARRRIKFDA